MEEPEDGFLKVKFMGPALETFREAYPDLPPADEMIVKMRLGKCGSCGKDMMESDSEFGGMDLEGITEDGEVVGTFICESCMKEGK